MECLALKRSSIRTEMAAFKEAVSDDCWGFNVAVQNPDDFSVDYLLDFSNEDVFFEELEEEHAEEKDSVFPAEENDNVSTTSSNSCMSEKNELEIELAVPTDENLEWLSHFVDDSLSGFNASLPVGITCFKPERKHELEFFKTPIPAKSRSKRSRTGGRVWSLSSPPSFTETSSSPSSSTSLVSPGFGLSVEKPHKKAKRPVMTEGVGSPRRCSHCGVNKTPQWRAGPNGAKTLCNACGVRYKSGRLVPEYRPACSPTFSSGVHSNHHRKVMELRRKKEDPVMISPAGIAPVMLRSF